jgi:hypothetical protein
MILNIERIFTDKTFLVTLVLASFGFKPWDYSPSGY